MTNDNDQQPAKALLLVSVLEKLRTRDGLTIDRLHAGRFGPTLPLLDLAATRCADIRDTDIARAAFDLVLTTVRERLHGTQQIVADAILALGVHKSTYAAVGLDERIIGSLYHTSLGRRREVLLNNWHYLHGALGLTTSEAPADRALRGTTEPAVLRELVNQLVHPDGYSAGARPVTTRELTAADDAARSGRVIVVGGAVMDATFRIKSLPDSETSTEAYDFDLSPGGKGLMQAIAAARLGLETSLIAAVPDDRFGEDILEQLESEGVDTSLIKHVEDASTPFTGVLEKELGDSIAVNWRNQREVFLAPRDIDDRARELVGCDVLMATFEVPRETLQRTLAIAHREPGNRPLVVVTPGQPYTDERISHETLAQIDYLVAHPWELGQFASAGEVPFSPDPIARKLVAFGVETLCLLVNGGCTIYSHLTEEATQVQAFPTMYKETSVARDAFCASLTAKLIENDRKFSDEVAIWASAAMSCAASGFRSSDSMPDRKRIERLLTRSTRHQHNPATA
ncbi:PfkB family carbohydrate kinase [Kribbella kalugense]|uniref:Sugar/nucleoside kinase (Ribokinase family) n=1 Tax=Kribbella kalugense TaxID=2512221 RepID=A0A4R8A0Z8_9ACTN|nr:PfkB family carbohydrate kinase [Kribbella kalugense]TDW22978.1 sugar/nucleoside kinase (ribokinase family) [Kribbella kalugense]